MTATSGSAAAKRQRRPPLLKGVRTTPTSTMPPSRSSRTSEVEPSETSTETSGKRSRSSRRRAAGTRPAQSGQTPSESAPVMPEPTLSTSLRAAAAMARILVARW